MPLKIGLLQLNSTIGDFAANRQKLVAGYDQACTLGAEFIIAPELFLCGYPPRDLLLRADFIDANLAALAESAKSIGPVPLCVGYVGENSERPGRPLRNSAAVLQNGRIVWRTHKSLLPTYDVFDEDRYFEPAKSVVPFEFNSKGIRSKLGITICEDIWNDEDFWPERLYRRDPIKELIGQGAEIILNISASPWHDGKEKTRLAMLQRVARDERVPLAQVNLVGANDELIFDGHSVALNRRGEPLALGKGFAEDILVVDLEKNSAPLAPSLSPPGGERDGARGAEFFPKSTTRTSSSNPFPSAITSPRASSATLWPSKISSSFAPTRLTCASGTRSSRATRWSIASRVRSLPSCHGDAERLRMISAPCAMSSLMGSRR